MTDERSEFLAKHKATLDTISNTFFLVGFLAGILVSTVFYFLV